MGCFDSVYFRCPKCNELLEEQSKAGDCLLHNYHESSVPAGIASAITGSTVSCYNCGSKYQIQSEAPRRVKMMLVPLGDDGVDGYD